MISKMELLKQITVVTFMKDNLGLFLNTHPMDKEAIKQYNCYVVESKALVESFYVKEKLFIIKDLVNLLELFRIICKNLIYLQ